MKKIIIGLAALAALASPVLAHGHHRAGNAVYSMSGKMHGTKGVSGGDASYAAAADTSINQRERDRAEAAQYR